MIEYKVTVDQDQLREAKALFEFVGGNSTRAVQVAINRAGPKVISGRSTNTGKAIPTNVSKEIRAQIRVTASFLTGKDEERPDKRPKLWFKKAYGDNLSGAIRTESRGLLLSHFDWKPKVSLYGDIYTPPEGIKVRVKPAGAIQFVKGKPSEVYGDPFYIRLKNSGKVGIGMWRVQSGIQGGRVKVLYGPSISQVFTDVKDTILPVAGFVYTEEMIDAMRYLLAMKYPPE